MDKTETTLKSQHKLPSVSVGDYNVELCQILGKGSYGIVYRAHHKTAKQTCAVKNITFPDDSTQLAKYEQSAEREWTILKRISHKNVIRYLDITIFSASWWIFLEYCDSKYLANYLKMSKHVSYDSKTDNQIQCAEAVRYIHSQDIIHRDVKLENYLVKGEKDKPVIRLSNFGLSKVVEEHAAE